MIKAQVFISCGQKTKEEKATGELFVRYFAKRGFVPYFAEEVHSPLGLTQDIYDNLGKSEYFVCVNFKRNNTNFGSLFVQQELAIASFKELPIAVFHQEGVRLEGVSKYLHVNSIKFIKSDNLVVDLDKVTKKWNPQSKNKLKLKYGNPHINVGIRNSGNIPSNWHHIIVRNLSAMMNVKNCYCFIESIKNLRSKRIVFRKSGYKNELIWAGTGKINVPIPTKGKRDVDAILTIQGSGIWQFHAINTSTIYSYPQLSDGEYKIIYAFYSDNFPSTKIGIHVRLQNDNLLLLSQRQTD